MQNPLQDHTQVEAKGSGIDGSEFGGGGGLSFLPDVSKEQADEWLK